MTLTPDIASGSGSGPRQARGAVVVCSDANWLWQSAFVLQQAIDSDPEALLDYYYYLDCDIADLPLRHLVDPRVKVVNAGPDLAAIDVTKSRHVPKATFLRFLALEALSKTHDRVAYLDGDLYLSWGSWTELFSLPPGENAVAAVAARPVWFNNPRFRYGRRYRKALCEAMGDRYLNAGMLLIHSARYQAQEISQRSLQFYADHPDLCGQGDQSALNAVLAGNWDELSPSWNWQVSSFNYPILADLNPRVVHFTGPIKPWNDTNAFFRHAFDDMAGFLAKHGATELLAELTNRLQPVAQISPRRARFIAEWTGDAAQKFRRISTYLTRRDFLDAAVGLQPFGAAKSGFGLASVPASPATEAAANSEIPGAAGLSE